MLSLRQTGVGRGLDGAMQRLPGGAELCFGWGSSSHSQHPQEYLVVPLPGRASQFHPLCITSQRSICDRLVLGEECHRDCPHLCRLHFLRPQRPDPQTQPSALQPCARSGMNTTEEGMQAEVASEPGKSHGQRNLAGYSPQELSFTHNKRQF